MQYDQYGNLETIIRPENEKGERLSIVYKYDNVVHTYPTNVSNSYGYVRKLNTTIASDRCW